MTRHKLVIQFVAISSASIFLVFLTYQLWDLKQELKRYMPVHPCSHLQADEDLRSYEFYGCANIVISPSKKTMQKLDEKFQLQTKPSITDSKSPSSGPENPSNGTPQMSIQDASIQQRVCGNRLKVLILVSSHYSHLGRRTAIRSTWGSQGALVPKWNTLFLLAQGKNKSKMNLALTEQKIYRDIIVGNFRESFYNLSFKVEFGFQWALRFCKFNYLLKADDDVFVNVPNLINFVRMTSTPQRGLYSGNVHYRAIVEREGRYGVTKDEYSKRIYPRYCSGGGFVLSQDVVNGIVAKVASFPNRVRLKIDDAYIGELALETGVDVYPSDDFLMFEESCTYKPNAVVFHPVKEQWCMKKLYIASTTPTKSTVRTPVTNSSVGL